MTSVGGGSRKKSVRNLPKTAIWVTAKKVDKTSSGLLPSRGYGQVVRVFHLFAGFFHTRYFYIGRISQKQNVLPVLVKNSYDEHFASNCRLN